MVQIIPATLNDVSLLHQLGERCFLPTYLPFIPREQVLYMFDMMYREQALLEQMTDKGHRFLLARRDSEYLGFASYQADFEPLQAKLHKLYVVPEKQVAGVGKALLTFAERQAAGIGQKSMVLNVNRENKALGFYTRLGYRIYKVVDIAIGEGYFMNDYEMVKTFGKE